jgi:hypothetical protein
MFGHVLRVSKELSAAALRKDFNFGELRYNRNVEDRVRRQCAEVFIGAGDGSNVS